jgi:hypothetical protein
VSGPSRHAPVAGAVSATAAALDLHKKLHKNAQIGANSPKKIGPPITPLVPLSAFIGVYRRLKFVFSAFLQDLPSNRPELHSTDRNDDASMSQFVFSTPNPNRLPRLH